jgi:chemotaxis protein MotB
MNHDSTTRHRRNRKYGVDRRAVGNHERWLVSYADLLTLLFALFVVLYAAADHDRARAIAKAMAIALGDSPTTASSEPGGNGILPGTNEYDATHQKVDRAFSGNERLRSSARVRTSERGLIISLAEAGFFAPGEATIRQDGLALVDDLADSLRDSGSLIRIEGHTDSNPISTPRFPSNWELSAARAAAVLARLGERGVSMSRMSVAGFGGERPVADNGTADGRAMNRRVDLVILRSTE